jgi:lipopolysaccharide export system protein LptA
MYSLFASNCCPQARTFILSVTLASALIFSPNSVHAERADRNKPVQVEADKMNYDDAKQVNVFTGNVVLTKGTLIIRADRITMRQDPEGYQYAVAVGKPASYRQKREGVEQHVEAYGSTLDYDGKTEVVKFIEKAYLKRLEKGKTTDEVYGAVVTYDAKTEIFNVEAGGSAVSPTNPAGRVKVIIQPKQTGDSLNEPTGTGTLLKSSEPLKPVR